MDAYRAPGMMQLPALKTVESSPIVTSEHASIIMEYLFRKAHDSGRDRHGAVDRRVRMELTKPSRQHWPSLQVTQTRAIDILAEREIPALDNKLMTAVRDAGFAERVVVTRGFPATIQASYQDHVIISDGRFTIDTRRTAAIARRPCSSVPTER